MTASTLRMERWAIFGFLFSTGLGFELIDLDRLRRELEFGDFDDQEVVLHGGTNFVERKVFRKDDRAGEGSEKAFFDEDASGFRIKIGAQALAGNGEDVAGNGDVDGIDRNAGERGDDDDGALLVQHVERDLADVLLDVFAAFVVVVHVDFVVVAVVVAVVADVEEFEHGKKCGKTIRNGIRSRRFCKFFGGMVDWRKPLQIRKNLPLDPLANVGPETAAPPSNPESPNAGGISAFSAFAVPETGTQAPAAAPLPPMPEAAGPGNPNVEKLKRGFEKTRAAVADVLTDWLGGDPTKRGILTAKKLKLAKKDKIFFLDAFGSLLNAGIPIVRSLQIIYFQSQNDRLRSIALFLKREIEGGANIAKTLAKFPKIFTTFDIAMIEMGEATGKIGAVIEIITEREEKSLELSRKVKQALIYPVAIAVIAAAMIGIIMTYVVPKVEAIYREANANLPAMTTAVIGTSRFLRTFGVPVLLFVLGAAIAAAIALKNPKIRFGFDRAILKMPIYGPILRKKILVSYCEFLSSLLTSGIVINKALLIVKNGLGNRYYAAEIDAILDDVKGGKPLSASMGGEYTEKRIRGEAIAPADEVRFFRKMECFPIELSTAVKVGEQTGMLAKMLDRTAKRYTREIDALVKNLSSALEPAVIVCVGGIVGTIVLAIMLPFFNMVNVVK